MYNRNKNLKKFDKKFGYIKPPSYICYMKTNQYQEPPWRPADVQASSDNSINRGDESLTIPETFYVNPNKEWR